jgi:hypothetical protein
MKKIEEIINETSIGDIVYYPGADNDYGPMELFSQNSFVKKIIYCDFGKNDNWQNRIEDLIINAGLTNNGSPIHLFPEDFGCNNWHSFFPEDNDSLEYLDSTNAFIFKYTLLTKYNQELEFYYFNTEAVETYKILLKNKLRPNLIVLQNHGMIGPHVGGDSLLYVNAQNTLPKFLYVAEGTQAWNGYHRISDYSVRRGSLHGHSRALFEIKPKRTENTPFDPPSFIKHGDEPSPK